MRGGLGALLVVGIALAIAAPTAAQTSGNETFNGLIVTSGSSGTPCSAKRTFTFSGVTSERAVRTCGRPAHRRSTAR